MRTFCFLINISVRYLFVVICFVLLLIILRHVIYCWYGIEAWWTVHLRLQGGGGCCGELQIGVELFHWVRHGCRVDVFVHLRTTQTLGIVPWWGGGCGGGCGCCCGGICCGHGRGGCGCSCCGCGRGGCGCSCCGSCCSGCCCGCSCIYGVFMIVGNLGLIRSFWHWPERNLWINFRFRVVVLVVRERRHGWDGVKLGRYVLLTRHLSGGIGFFFIHWFLVFLLGCFIRFFFFILLLGCFIWFFFLVPFLGCFIRLFFLVLLLWFFIRLFFLVFFPGSFIRYFIVLFLWRFIWLFLFRFVASITFFHTL